MIFLVVYLQLLLLGFSTEPDFYELENIVVCLSVCANGLALVLSIFE